MWTRRYKNAAPFKLLKTKASTSSQSQRLPASIKNAAVKKRNHFHIVFPELPPGKKLQKIAFSNCWRKHGVDFSNLINISPSQTVRKGSVFPIMRSEHRNQKVKRIPLDLGARKNIRVIIQSLRRKQNTGGFGFFFFFSQ